MYYSQYLQVEMV